MNCKIFILFILILGHSSMNGQVTTEKGMYLEVPLIGQLKSNWCWAAAMEMVDSFHNNSNKQCDFVKRYHIIKGSSLDINDCCTDDCLGAIDEYPPCNETIIYSKRNRKPLHPNYFDFVFNHFEYNSLEDIQTEKMDWVSIKKEINSCRPFIVLMDKIDSRVNPFLRYYHHALVAKGYYTISENTNATKFILTNDPQNVPDSCDACEYLLPISSFSEKIGTFNSVSEVVRSITPRDKNPCDSCLKTKPIIQSNLIADIETAYSNNSIFGIDDQTITDIQLGIILGNSTKYSYNNLEYTSFSGDTKNVRLVATELPTPKLAIYLEQNDTNNDWTIKGITNYNCTPFDFSKIPGSFILAGSTINPSKVDYKIILPTNASFYKIIHKDKPYLSPTSDIFKYKAGQLYPEEDVITKLKEDFEENVLGTIIEEETKKTIGFWPFRWLFNLLNKHKKD